MQTAPDAIKKYHIQIILKGGDLAANGGLCLAQHLRGLGQGPAFDDAQKGSGMIPIKVQVG